MSGTRDVLRTYRVVTEEGGISMFLDIKGTRVDFEGRILVVYSGDRIAAVFAEDTWKHVREYNEDA
jgi:hypothetical protein